MLVGVGGAVGDKRLDEGRLRRQPGEIEGDAAGERAPVGLRGGGEPFGLEALQNEPVDRIADPRLLLHCRRFRSLWRDERPMGLVLGPFLHPPREDLFLLCAQRLLRGRRGHHVVGIVGVDAVEEGGGVGVARDQGAELDRRVALVEPQAGLAGGAVGPVAGEAVLDQERPNVFVVGKVRGGSGGRLIAAGGGGKREQAQTGEGRATQTVERGHGVSLADAHGAETRTLVPARKPPRIIAPPEAAGSHGAENRKVLPIKGLATLGQSRFLSL